MSKRVIETSGDDAKATARHAKIAKEKEQAEEEEKNRASNEYWKVRRANEKRKEEIKKLPKEEQAEAKKKLREDVKKNKEMYRREKKKAREEEREQRKAEKAEALRALADLKGCQAHCSVILSPADEITYRKLGLQLTCEPQYQTNKLYHR